MGRYSYSTKEKADFLDGIHISWLKKHGYMEGLWHSGTIVWSNKCFGIKYEVDVTIIIKNMTGQLHYFQNGREFNYSIGLTTTPCHYGGVRYWFICPGEKSGVPCKRRVGVLYRSGVYFACRFCHDLTYKSKNMGRGGWLSSVMKIYALGDKFETAHKAVKRLKYGSKLTKNFQRREKIVEKMERAARDLEIETDWQNK